MCANAPSPRTLVAHVEDSLLQEKLEKSVSTTETQRDQIKQVTEELDWTKRRLEEARAKVKTFEESTQHDVSGGCTACYACFMSIRPKINGYLPMSVLLRMPTSSCFLHC